MTREEMIDEAVRRALKPGVTNQRAWWYITHREWVRDYLRPIVVREFNLLRYEQRLG